jgi:hypothetical protein
LSKGEQAIVGLRKNRRLVYHFLESHRLASVPTALACLAALTRGPTKKSWRALTSHCASRLASHFSKTWKPSTRFSRPWKFTFVIRLECADASGDGFWYDDCDTLESTDENDPLTPAR